MIVSISSPTDELLASWRRTEEIERRRTWLFLTLGPTSKVVLKAERDKLEERIEEVSKDWIVDVLEKEFRDLSKGTKNAWGHDGGFSEPRADSEVPGKPSQRSELKRVQESLGMDPVEKRKQSVAHGWMIDA
ncbi:hypothetical protein AXG93_163s1200 [Marchantia polymorpha subsp. ruderalis]|uniref:Uncharacterized protein n=1 Tax=Marchantia polymorpha subsp. ruderalis TaxID=1480154 RepID=A0A176VC51_MARPO|nr:hypothetical protein AXG93_163s1200 [Marchantia polymorpha subsp. ruderalis]